MDDSRGRRRHAGRGKVQMAVAHVSGEAPRMISLDVFSQLLEVLYRAPCCPENWQRCMDSLAEVTGSRGTYLLIADSSRRLTVRLSGGRARLGEAMQQKYNNEIAAQDPYRKHVLSAGRPALIDADAFVAEEELLKTSLYRQILKPQGLRHPTTLLLKCSIDRLEVVSVWRSPEEGRMPEAGMRLLELLLPHLQVVSELQQHLGALSERLTGAEAVARASQKAAFAVTSDGRLLYANPAADAILQEQGGLRIEKGVLCATGQEMREKLRAMLARKAAVPRVRPAPSSLCLERAGRTPLQLLAMPMATKTAEHGVLLLANDPEQPVQLAGEAMRAFYRLTEAETAVANGLLTGYNPSEIALLRKVSVSTVRSQLKSLFSKTGTSSQPQLVARLMAAPGLS